ncbi:MAG: hypothetical protein V4731_15230 [Pseudomonadota bacterium]
MNKIKNAKTLKSALKTHQNSDADCDPKRNHKSCDVDAHHDLFLEFARYRWVVIRGCPGSGKTALAAKWIAHVGMAAVILATSKSGREKLKIIFGKRPNVSVLMLNEVDVKDVASSFVVIHDCHRTPKDVHCFLETAGHAHVMLLTQDAEPSYALSAGPWDEVKLIHSLDHSFTVASGIVPLANVLASSLAHSTIESTSRTGARPLQVEFDEPEALARFVNAEIQDLLSDGVSASEIVVVCGSGAESRQMSSRLLRARIAAHPLTHMTKAREFKRVLWLTRLAIKLRRGERLAPVDRRNSAVFLKLLGEPKWSKLLHEIRMIKVTSLESIYCLCCEAYLRVQGGVRAHHNRLLRSYLMVWEPVARASKSASDLFKLSESAEPIRCLTPQAARGGAWEYVFIAGLTNGVWTVRPEHTDIRLLRELLLDTITRCTRQLRILICPAHGESGSDVVHRIAGDGLSKAMCSYGSMRS